jgi:site-specific DNA-methyltransferase (adenine-specific)
MKPYYEDEFVAIYNADFREVELPRDGVVVTDPPYNMGYHYKSYSDDLTQHAYLNLLERSMDICENNPFVMVNYPELTTSFAVHIGHAPKKLVSWVYSANTPRQWRAISWFFITPDLSLSGQPYKNPTDRRIKERIENGEEARLYDWWYEDQVKNISDEKTDHPCQIPESLMKRILTVTPASTYIDPFMGSGTTLRAAKDLNRKAIGIEIEERYCEIAANRMAQLAMEL